MVDVDVETTPSKEGKEAESSRKIIINVKSWSPEYHIVVDHARETSFTILVLDTQNYPKYNSKKVHGALSTNRLQIINR